MTNVQRGILTDAFEMKYDYRRVRFTIAHGRHGNRERSVNLLFAFEREALKRRKAFAVAICQGTLGDDERDRREVVKKRKKEGMNEKEKRQR